MNSGNPFPTTRGKPARRDKADPLRVEIKITGPSGSGKTALAGKLRAMLAREAPTASVEISEAQQ